MEAGVPLFITETRLLDPGSHDCWHSYPLYGGEMTSMTIHPKDEEIIFLGTRSAGVFKTMDGGQTWAPAGNGLTFFPIRSLAVDPQNPEILFAGTDIIGIWKSTNGGTSWLQTGYGGDLVVFNMIINPQNPQILYAGEAVGVGLDLWPFILNQWMVVKPGN